MSQAEYIRNRYHGIAFYSRAIGSIADGFMRELWQREHVRNACRKKQRDHDGFRRLSGLPMATRRPVRFGAWEPVFMGRRKLGAMEKSEKPLGRRNLCRQSRRRGLLYMLYMTCCLGIALLGARACGLSSKSSYKLWSGNELVVLA